MEGHGHHHHHQQQQQQYLHNPFHPQPQPQPPAVGETADSRFPQWSIQETKEFLVIRAELDRTFMETKRNKLLWEVISTKMKDKGFHRSAEQCKCKWKNLVTRYKGCETMEPEAMRQQFPFYTELQAIFAARMQRMLWAEAEGTASASAGGKKNKAAGGGGQLSSDEDYEEEEEASEGDKLLAAAAAVNTSRKRMKKGKGSISSSGGNAGVGAAAMKEVMEGFVRQQMAMEVQWREAYEARENERAAKEAEWRRTMEALEKERLMMERRWREREEQRRAREEARADKRDALITALLNKLARDEQP
ncbi:unnamed protein product [Linum tenue]|uniref:Myb-like domain-containing protein n=1 Tax=Linum tenue TaxID=586396 RepID=A0AAV0KT13_9ROSI|nr:unnamed protein product [Linum tenue]